MNYVSHITLPDSSSFQIKDPFNYLYGVCTTLGSVAAKEVTLSDFELLDNITIHVKFNEANNAANPTLSVNSSAAKAIFLPNDNISPWDAGEVVSLTYDGTYWRLNDYSKVEVIRL